MILIFSRSGQSFLDSNLVSERLSSERLSRPAASASEVFVGFASEVCVGSQPPAAGEVRKIDLQELSRSK
jgi:hypothetical protein